MLAWIGIGLMAISSSLAENGGLPARLRGVDAEGNVLGSKALTAEAVTRMAQWGVNVVRVTLTAPAKPVDVDPANPLAPYAEDLNKLRDVLSAIAAQPVKVIVAFEFDSQPEELWSKSEDGEKLRAQLIAFWKAFAREFKTVDTIIGYDLLNKPNDTTPRFALWNNELLPAVVSAVREENPSVWLFVQPASWGRPYGFDKFPVLGDQRIVYSFQMYAPFNYVYQGIGKERAATRGKLTYPGRLVAVDYDPKEQLWDKKALVEYLKPAIDFAKEHQVRMAAVSFGVARWAPGREAWTADVVGLFEQHGWDWCYASLVGSNGMNPTYEADDPSYSTAPGSAETPVLKILQESWRKK